MLLPAIVAFDVILFRTPMKKLLARHWPLVLIGGGWLAVTSNWLDRSVSGAVRPLYPQLLTQAKAIGYYAHLIAVPTRLNVEPQFAVSSQMSTTSLLCALLLLSAVTVAWRASAAPGRCLLVMAGLWMLPTTVMPLNVLVNERRAYMLVALLCVGAGLLFTRSKESRL